MKSKKAVLLALLTISVFFIGYVMGSNELPFNDTLKILYRDATQMDNNEKFEYVDPFFYKTNVSSLMDIKTEQDIKEKRKNLIEFIWKESNFPYQDLPTKIETSISDERFDKLTNLKRIDKYTISMDYGVNSTAYLFLAKEENNKLVIYHEGHGGNFVRGYDIISTLLENNYSVIAFSMPLLGLNNQPEVEIPHLGKIVLKNHNNLQFLDNDEFSSIKFFLHPIAVSLNYLDQTYNFDTYYMVGISGGAWTTTLYSAIDDRIQKSYPVGGPLPLFLTINVPGNNGDYELNLPELYNKANFLELFIMGSYGNGREQLKILNKCDSCCYYGISYQVFEDDVKQVMRELGSGSFEVYLDTTHKEHKISETALNLILNSMHN
jgi:hypothetical protein